MREREIEKIPSSRGKKLGGRAYNGPALANDGAGWDRDPAGRDAILSWN